MLVVDNYDSFTWNIVHYLRALGAQVRVERTDDISVADAFAYGADGILVSPGPGRPEEAGISMALVAACAEAAKPLLGICLGHQAIAATFGGRVVRAPKPMHGKTCPVSHDGGGLFEGMPSPFTAARYHSLVAEPSSVPDCLIVNATADDATVQGLRHRSLPIHGVQFHPESVASEGGYRMLANFIQLSRNP
ncbi:anthranilate synthase component II [Allosphingosinicella deserti]|uniref:Aminodeoxychorismate/anthranilate synthase component II n=1 Tax=Allosphingosinicella deserti TaxID=2116704 RepID=A0A2P7QPU3_9SPHN|nr:aminodeoxychorismate/anthranilate synthase component II [Sphingomonas deserti]PSJ40003.1 aminodeoxychorismate/anthranilate synthase component II [Sphingomonas deserti]